MAEHTKGSDLVTLGMVGIAIYLLFRKSDSSGFSPGPGSVDCAQNAEFGELRWGVVSRLNAEKKANANNGTLGCPCLGNSLFQ